MEVITISEGLDPTTGSLSVDVANDGTHHEATRRIRILCSIVVELKLIEANINEVLKAVIHLMDRTEVIIYCGPLCKI